MPPHNRQLRNTNIQAASLDFWNLKKKKVFKIKDSFACSLNRIQKLQTLLTSTHTDQEGEEGKRSHLIQNLILKRKKKKEKNSLKNRK